MFHDPAPRSSTAGRDSVEAERKRWVEVLASLLTRSHPVGQVAGREGCQSVSPRREQESQHVEGKGQSISSLSSRDGIFLEEMTRVTISAVYHVTRKQLLSTAALGKINKQAPRMFVQVFGAFQEVFVSWIFVQSWATKDSQDSSRGPVLTPGGPKGEPRGCGATREDIDRICS